MLINIVCYIVLYFIIGFFVLVSDYIFSGRKQYDENSPNFVIMTIWPIYLITAGVITLGMNFDEFLNMVMSKTINFILRKFKK